MSARHACIARRMRASPRAMRPHLRVVNAGALDALAQAPAVAGLGASHRPRARRSLRTRQERPRGASSGAYLSWRRSRLGSAVPSGRPSPRASVSRARLRRSCPPEAAARRSTGLVRAYRSSCMERESASVTIAIRGCRSAVWAGCAAADAWPSSMSRACDSWKGSRMLTKVGQAQQTKGAPWERPSSNDSGSTHRSLSDSESPRVVAPRTACSASAS